MKTSKFWNGMLGNDDNKFCINIVKQVLLNRLEEYKDSLSFIERELQENNSNIRLLNQKGIVKEVILEHRQLLKELGLGGDIK